jgi:hypothetical protein
MTKLCVKNAFTFEDKSALAFADTFANLTFKKIYDIILKKTIFFRAVSLLSSKLLNAGDFTIN